jgi:hypothetical protein
MSSPFVAPLISLGIDLLKSKLKKEKVDKEVIKEKAVEALTETFTNSPVTTGLGTLAGTGALLMDTETLLQILPMIPADHHVYVLLGMYVTSAILLLVGKKLDK